MSEKKKPRNKVKNLMLAQTPEQLKQISAQIPDIMENLVRDNIEANLKVYAVTLENRLGLTKDDLLNDIREQLWKALITFNPHGGANLSTYCRRLIENRFGVLLKQAGRHKYTSVEYHANVFSSGIINEDQLVSEETGETIFERRHEFMKDLAHLNESDRILYSAIEQGHGLSELSKLTGKTVVEVTAAVKRIEILIRKRRERI